MGLSSAVGRTVASPRVDEDDDSNNRVDLVGRLLANADFRVLLWVKNRVILVLRLLLRVREIVNRH